MKNDIFLVFQILAAIVFFATLYAGYYLLKHSQRLFGVDPNVPSEVGSARALNKTQVFAIWAHVLLASAAFAIALH